MSAAIFIGIFLLISALCTSALMLRRDVTTQPLLDRLNALRQQEPNAAPGVASIRRVQTRQAPWAARLCKLIALDLENRNQYTIAWPIVVAVSCGVGAASYWFAGGLVGQSVGSVAALAAGVFCTRSLFQYQRRNYAGRVLNQLPDAIGLIVRGASVGIPVAEAAQAISRELPEPIAGEFARISREVTLGTALETAISDVYRRTGLPEFAFLAVTVGLQQRSGGSSSTALSNLADIVSKRIAMAARAKALSGEARVSILILSVLPFVAGGFTALSNWAYMELLFTTPTGATLQKVFVGLFSCGLMAMRWLMRRATRG